jgi:uncharacterized membrane protein
VIFGALVAISRAVLARSTVVGSKNTIVGFIIFSGQLSLLILQYRWPLKVLFILLLNQNQVGRLIFISFGSMQKICMYFVGWLLGMGAPFVTMYSRVLTQE